MRGGSLFFRRFHVSPCFFFLHFSPRYSHGSVSCESERETGGGGNIYGQWGRWTWKVLSCRARGASEIEYRNTVVPPNPPPLRALLLSIPPLVIFYACMGGCRAVLTSLKNAVRDKHRARQAAQEALAKAQEEAEERVAAALQEAEAAVLAAKRQVESTRTAERSAKRLFTDAQRQQQQRLSQQQ